MNSIRAAALAIGTLFSFFALMPAAFSAQDAPGFPVRLPAVASGPLAIGNGPGKIPRAYLSVGGSDIACIEITGRACEGFPISLGKQHGLSGSPALADLNGDGTDELVILEASGALHVFDAHASVLLTVPREAAPQPTTPPSLVDLNGDGRADAVFFGDASAKITALNLSDGSMVSGFPRQVRSIPTSRISFGYFGNPGRLALFWGSEDGKINGAWSDSGDSIPGFPVSTGYSVSAAPTLADFDGSGTLSICAASQDFKIHLFGESGAVQRGFPVETGIRLKDAPAIAQFGSAPGSKTRGLFCVVAAGDGKIHVLSKDGSERRGFPVNVGQKIAGNAIAADLDGDGTDEILAAGTEGKLFAVKSDGRLFPGYPTALAGVPDVGPAAVVWQGAVIVLQPAGETLHALRQKPRRAGNLSWPQDGGDSARSGRSSLSKPVYKNLKLSPERPRISDELILTYDYRDPHGQQEPAVPVVWFRNGTHVPELDGKTNLPAGTAKKGETWRASIARRDAYVLTQPSVTVENTPPGAPDISFDPEIPLGKNSLKAVISVPAEDADGDSLSYKYRWFIGGHLLPTVKGDTLPAGKLKRGDEITVEVTPIDGSAEGPSVRKSERAGNSIPLPPKFHLSETAPKCGAPIQIRIDSQAPDADGDALSYRITVFLNGQELPLTRESQTIDTSGFRHGDKIQVRIAAFDGFDESAALSKEAVIANCPPPPPEALIYPPSPVAGDTLTPAIRQPLSDMDRDPISYRFEFQRDGKNLGSQVSGVKKGERYSLLAAASDGQSETAGEKIFVTIGNTPPNPPKIRWETPAPTSQDNLVVRVSAPAVDPDGDKTELRYAWSVNGRELQGEAGATLKKGKFKKGDRVEVTVTPFDGTNEGKPARLAVLIANAAPTTPKISLSPARPSSTDKLTVTLSTPGKDFDGDKVTHKFRWFVDGFELPLENNAAELLPGRAAAGASVEVKVTASDDDQGKSAAATAKAVILPAAPPKPSVTIHPSSPTLADTLECRVQAAEGTSVESYQWFADGKLIPQNPSVSTLPAARFQSQTSIRCAAVASRDGLTARAESSPVRLSPHAPSAPEITIDPSVPKSGDDLICRITKRPANDGGLPVRYVFKWFEDDKPVHSAPGNPAKLSAASLKKGPSYRCEVTAENDAGLSPKASAVQRYANTLPGAPAIRLKPESPHAKTPLECELIQEAADPDGDALKYRFIWWKDGAEQPFSPTSQRVPARILRQGQKWRCGAAASDAEGEGPITQSLEVTIQAPPATR